MRRMTKKIYEQNKKCIDMQCMIENNRNFKKNPDFVGELEKLHKIELEKAKNMELDREKVVD